MPFTTYMRSALATLVALTSVVALAQTSATKTQTVILVVQGETHLLRTSAKTVDELLKEQRIVLNEQLQISTSQTSLITEGMQITLEPKSASEPKSVMVPTKATTATKSTTVTKSTTATKSTKSTPVTKTVASRGTLSSRGGLGNLSRYEGKRVLTLTATGYGPGENGRWGNRTALGTRVRYGIVAVDPRVIKLGTRLYVEGYGECVAEDTGGAIKGMRIDLAYNSDVVANQYGRKRVRVVILD